MPSRTVIIPVSVAAVLITPYRMVWKCNDLTLLFNQQPAYAVSAMFKIFSWAFIFPLHCSLFLSPPTNKMMFPLLYSSIYWIICKMLQFILITLLMFRRSKLASAKKGGGGESYEWTEIWFGNRGFTIAIWLKVPMLEVLSLPHLSFEWYGICITYCRLAFVLLTIITV